MTFASGHTAVSAMSDTRNPVGSNLLPAPMALISGTLAAAARSASSSFPLTVSIASMI